jgi:hypothetical protein
MRRIAWTLLPFLALLNGCPQRKTAGPAPDYESARQSSEQSHQGLDQQQAPSEGKE